MENVTFDSCQVENVTANAQEAGCGHLFRHELAWNLVYYQSDEGELNGNLRSAKNRGPTLCSCRHSKPSARSAACMSAVDQAAAVPNLFALDFRLLPRC